MIRKMRSRLAPVLPPVLLISLSIFLFGPATVYKGNAVEFGFPLSDLLSVYLIPGIILVLLLIGISLVLSERLLRWYISILFAGGLLLYIQSSFLIWNYGLFDGNLIDWSKYRWQGYFDLLIWLVILILALAFRKKILRFSSLVCWSLILLQGVLFIVPASSQNNKPVETNSGWEIPPDLYNYSDSLNVIHFMCDGFQTDVFLECINENSFESTLEGFTVFRENITNADKTSISIPSIFSGDVYDGSVPVGEFFHKNISEKGFHNILYQNGFKVNFIPHISMPQTNVTNYYTIPTLYKKSEKDECVYKAAYLLDIGLFRVMPHFVKQVINNGGNWRISTFFAESSNQQIRSVVAFMQDYTKKIVVSGSKPVYHFIFLYPPHPPNVIEKDGTIASEILPPTRENYKSQATHTLNLFVDFLNGLKQNGLFEKSLIILQSDHGALFQPIINGNEILLETGRIPTMLAIKRPNEKGNLKFSDAQTMNADVAATILDFLKIDHKFNGTSVFSIDTMNNRPRDFVTESKRYTILGSIYKSTSWINSVGLKSPKRNPVYTWDSVISFGLMGNAEIFQDTGWSVPRSNDQWNNGKLSRLNFVVNETESDILLEATFTPFLSTGKLDTQRVNILVNNKMVGQWVLTENCLQSKTVLIPNKILNGKSLDLSFIFPDATSPTSLNLDQDHRLLAIKMKKMLLRQIHFQYSLGQILRFTGECPSQKYLVEGWSDPEPQHRWTNGPEARLRFSFPAKPVRDLRLRLHGNAYTGKGKIKYQPVTVIANEQIVATWQMQGDDWYTADIPVKLVASGSLNVTFRIEKPMSPKDAENSADTRQLGLSLRELVIEEKN
ncbi:MAG: sulfatase-like hydrolase/transferase [Bacteroidales bacterium]|nr:sulfatase-like hydrolase/transferase [Bacteroidales bacterium]